MMRALRLTALAMALSCVFGIAHAAAARFDYRLQPKVIAPGVWVFVGKDEDFSFSNGGNIVNTGFIVSDAGVSVIDSGPSARYGEQMRAAIAAVTPLPIRRVFNTHHHPDHFLGNQAFAPARIVALAATLEGIRRDGNTFAENMYRMNGDWMRDTEARAPDQAIDAQTLVIGHTPPRALRILNLRGHTAADLALYDESAGVLFAGDLVFHGRAPTTPHANIGDWLQALDVLEAITREPGFRVLVPGHGRIGNGAEAIAETRAWLHWLQATLADAARTGLDMNEVLALPLPARWQNVALAGEEFRRSVTHLYPALEAAALRGDNTPPSSQPRR